MYTLSFHVELNDCVCGRTGNIRALKTETCNLSIGRERVIYLWSDDKRKRMLVAMLQDYEAELERVNEEIACSGYDPNLSARILMRNKDILRRNFRVSERHKFLLMRAADLEATIDRLRLCVEDCYSFVCESASEGEIQTELNITQNFTDAVGADAAVGLTGLSSVPMSMKHQLPVDDFFSRPISITDFEEKTAADFLYILPIWKLYTDQPSVRAKLRNYSFLKADMVVMVEVSGTPFHYGKALISYQAYPECNDNLLAHSANFINDTDSRQNYLNYLSQAYGSTTIDYNGNRPVHVRCPFISPKPMHRLYNGATTVIAAATYFDDLFHAGSLYIVSINPVSAATASPTPIGVHVYAWLENVELGPPTGTQIAITTEGGKRGGSRRDERVTGPVERVSSALVSLSDAVGVIPSIAPFAKASSMFLGIFSHLASVFGWSKPLLEDKPSFVKNRPFANAAYGIGQDTSSKISLDPKQELTVDPRICGVSDDELSIAFMSSVQSYLTTFSWAEDDAVGTPIWACAVHPQLDTYFDIGVADYFIQPTAMSFAVAPFAFWRGTIKFRLEIACSKFHRGKFLIRYEPNAEQYALIETDSSLNKQYIKVIDIQETQDVEFCVKYAQPYTWCSTVTIPNSVKFHGSAIDIPGLGQTYANGFISIRPFTTLQSPDLSDIFFNVYVSAEDLQVNVMHSGNIPTQRYTLSAESAMFVSESDNGASPEVGYTCFDLNEVSDTASGCTELCFGEQPLTFRTCLKRFQPCDSTVFALSASARKSNLFTRNNHPLNPTQYSTTIATTNTDNFYHYLQYAFLGYKGSSRWKLHIWNVTKDQAPGMSTTITFGDITTSSTESGPTAASTGATVNVIGGVLFDQHTNSGIEVELPYYSPNLFSFSFSALPEGVLTAGMLHLGWVRQHKIWVDNNTVSNDMVITREFAVGEDFQFLRFNGAPYFTRVTA